MLLIIINLTTNVVLEAKYTRNATKILILQQKFENFCKIWAVDAAHLWFKSFYFVTLNSTFDIVSLCFSVINLSTERFFYLMKVLIVLIPWVKAWHIHLFISLNKLRDNKASEIDIFTNKLDNSDNTTILWVFLTHFHFKSVLSSNTHSWLANICYS